MYVYLHTHICVHLFISRKEYTLPAHQVFYFLPLIPPVVKLPLKQLGKLVTVADLGQLWEHL